MSKWQSQCMRLPFCCSRLPNLQAVHQARIVLLLLVLCSVFPFLFASECADNEIPGPESGYIYPQWQPDDKVLALQMEHAFIPDKVQYDKGEVIEIEFIFKVNKESRGYVPNRKYCVTSIYLPGFEIHSKGNLYWKIIKTDIDTLNTITDNQPLEGKVKLKLVDYREQETENSENNGMKLKPWVPDTQRDKNGSQGLPPLMSFDAYRVATSETGQNTYKHNKGHFFYDQSGGYNFEAEKLKELRKSRHKTKSEIPSSKSGPYYQR